VSNDNPYSEAAFKTLKYAPVFPESFGSLADARAFCEAFFSYYNHEHRHSGIGLHTPASVHQGTATEIRAQRQHTLDAAHAAHPTGSATADPRHPSCPRPPGSTNPHRRPSYRPRDETCLRLLDIFRNADRPRGTGIRSSAG
jgi:putative transposase